MPRIRQLRPWTNCKAKKAQLSVIQNKFFLKSNRFEIAPVLGYIPNNDLVSVPVGGMFLAYHFSESFAAEASMLYGADTQVGGLKGLAKTLMDIGVGADDFQQPIDRVSLGAVFDARFSPVYGKINLLGEGVINFDFYGTVGVGLLVVDHELATNSEDSISLNDAEVPFSAYPALNLGVGFDFFITQGIALKIDARSMVYVGQEPDYGTESELGSRLYNAFITTGGVSIFIPKMKPRLSNF